MNTIKYVVYHTLRIIGQSIGWVWDVVVRLCYIPLGIGYFLFGFGCGVYARITGDFPKCWYAFIVRDYPTE